MLRILLLALAVLAIAACSDTPDTTTASSAVPDTTAAVAAPTTLPAPATTQAPVDDDPAEIPDVLSDFAVTSAYLDDLEILVAVADTGELRRRGLMQVEDLLDLDGMLFVFEEDATGGFWMKDTLIPLDISFFDAAGRFVDGFTMEPCTTAECPTYRPTGAYRYAVEMAAGTMPPVVEELRVDL